MGRKLRGIGKRLGNIVFGSKPKGEADTVVGLDASLQKSVDAQRAQQLKNTSFLSDLMAKENARIFDEGSLANLLRNQSAQREGQIRASGEDQRRNAEQMVAQRGLGNSAAGISAILNSNRNVGEQIGAERAQTNAAIPEALRQRRQEFEQGRISNILNLSSGINQQLGAPGAQSTFIKGYRGGERGGGMIESFGMNAAGAAGQRLGGNLLGGGQPQPPQPKGQFTTTSDGSGSRGVA